MAIPTKTYEEFSALGRRAAREGQESKATNNTFIPTDRSRGDVGGIPQQWVTGTFTDRASAERAYNSLLSRGYDEKDINLIMSDATREFYFTEPRANDEALGPNAMKCAGFGGAIGITAGAILMVLVANGTTIAIPKLGLVIAGSIALALAGAGAGAITGGILGALVGWGLTEARAKTYDSNLHDGGIILGVSPHNDADAAYFEGQWRAYNGQRI